MFYVVGYELGPVRGPADEPCIKQYYESAKLWAARN